MGLNIKNERVHELVQELAAMTGQTQTDAVSSAVEDKLAAVRQRAGDGVAARLLAIGGEMSMRLSEPYKSREHGDLLYDEHGLPS